MLSLNLNFKVLNQFLFESGILSYRINELDVWRGFLKGWNKEMGLFSRLNSEKLYKIRQILEIGTLAYTEILYFDRYLTEILK